MKATSVDKGYMPKKGVMVIFEKANAEINPKILLKQNNLSFIRIKEKKKAKKERSNSSEKWTRGIL